MPYLVVIQVRLKHRVRCYSTFPLIDFPTHLFVIPIIVRLISTHPFARQKRRSRIVSTLYHMTAGVKGHANFTNGIHTIYLYMQPQKPKYKTPVTHGPLASFLFQTKPRNYTKGKCTLPLPSLNKYISTFPLPPLTYQFTSSRHPSSTMHKLSLATQKNPPCLKIVDAEVMINGGGVLRSGLSGDTKFVLLY